MADYNSSVPIRTENAGDVAVKIADATVTSQQLKVNPDGSIDANILNNITLTGEVEIKNDAGNPVPISATSLPLPTGASTLAEQQTQTSHLNDIETELLAQGTTLDEINSKLAIKTGVADYNTNAALASGGTNTHTYTAVSNFYFTGVEASGSGKMKIEVVVNGVTKFVQFNSTSTPNMTVQVREPLMITSGQTVQVIRTNRDNQAQDVYSTILGFT
jgi:hypothetical protein